MDSKNTNNKKQIVVPSALNNNLIKKLSLKKPIEIKEYEKNYEEEFEEEDVEEKDDIEENINETPKRRGRPSKKAIIEVL